MNTTTHFLLAYVLGRFIKLKKKVHMKGLLWGSIAPDIALFLLTGGYFLYRQIKPIDEFIFGPTYDALFFSNPFWLFFHNFFHAPIILLAIGYLGWWAMKKGKKWGFPTFWFAIGAASHTILDIPTHHNDGPLLFFPFEWTIRYDSPISYWHPEHGGRTFTLIELIVTGLILAYLAVEKLIKWKKSKK